MLMFGRRAAAWIYALAALLVPIWIVGAFVAGTFPVWALYGALPSIFLVKPLKWAFGDTTTDPPIPAGSAGPGRSVNPLLRALPPPGGNVALAAFTSPFRSGLPNWVENDLPLGLWLVLSVVVDLVFGVTAWAALCGRFRDAAAARFERRRTWFFASSSAPPALKE